MEVALCAALTTVWWISSVSVLLPFVFLLKYSKTFRDKWFSWFFMRCLSPIFQPKLVPFRKQCFELLKEHLKDWDKSRPIRILEIGIGSGANLQFYPDNSHLTAVDMNASFETYFRENQKKYPQVTYKRTVLCMAENMHEIEDSSMDIVVSTYVLCSVENIEAVLKEVKRVLKENGKFLFLEHVAFPESEWSFTIQRVVAPLWALYFDGCCPHRNIGDQVHEAGFSNVVCKKMNPSSVLLFIR
ncbi:Methyltransferase-like protein 7A, partial [Stegodyphus mimosarum]